MAKEIGLLRVRRFLPLFVAHLSGIFALALLTGFVAAHRGGFPLPASALAAPFVLFSATAGELADRYARPALLRLLKFVALAAALGGAFSLFTASGPLSLAALFASAAAAAFASPVEYALLPQQLREEERGRGSALFLSGTFLAAFFGLLAGALAATTAAVLLACGAALAFSASWFVPAAPAAAPDLLISLNPLEATEKIFRLAGERERVRLALLAGSWFWLAGGALLVLTPSLGMDPFLGVALAVLGTSLGSLSGEALAGGLSTLEEARGSARGTLYAPAGALAMALFLFDLALAPRAGPLLFFDFVASAIAGGLFVTPLWASLAETSEDGKRGRLNAGANCAAALALSAGAMGTAILLLAGLGREPIAILLGLGSLVAGLRSLELLPPPALRTLGRTLFRFAYRVEVRGAENFEAAGKRAVIVPNHVSFLDGPLVASFLPEDLIYAIDPGQFRYWWARPFLAAAEGYLVDPTHPMATKSLIRVIEGGRRAVIFPEGRINVTGGALMKIYEGPAMVADKAQALVVPVRLDGPEFSPFSRLSGTLKRRLFPRITITILEPRRLQVPEGLRGRARRHRAGLLLYDVMSEMMARRPSAESLYAEVLSMRRTQGGRSRIFEDPTPAALTYNRAIAASEVLGRRLAARTRRGEFVGIMLPTSIGAAIAFLALQAFGRVPAMLNFSAGADGVLSACRTAGLKTVLCSRRFIEAARLESVAKRLEGEVALISLEDLRKEIGLKDRLYGLIARHLAARRHRRLKILREEPAAVLFTSGSEGAPKGVVLSHANLLANRRQNTARIDFSPKDRVLNALPLFHSFGLMGGFLMPLLSGVPVFLYPSPLHYRTIPELSYNIAATILFGTDTFLMGYAKRGNPYDFYSLRYVFSGGEPVREETRAVWFERFGMRILEGYGVTECSPVIAVSTAMHFKSGSVGRFLPLLEWRLEPVSGIEKGGRLFVKGPNVMLGYLRAERPGVLEPPEEGWHDTGDVLAVDEEGYVSFEGRLKRFAKIAGEMIALATSERIAEIAYPEGRHAVVAVPDRQRGEAPILVTEAKGVERQKLIAAAHRLGVSELAVPRGIVEVERLPLLGTGKPDYPAVARLLEEARGRAGTPAAGVAATQ